MTLTDLWRCHHQVVREFAWALFSPPMATFSTERDGETWGLGCDEEAQYLLTNLAANPASLETALCQLNDRRLGARFEALWQYFFDHHSFYRVLAANLQINTQGRTLGALDFLLEDGRCNQIVHLELAVKFYLYCPSDNGDSDPQDLFRWIGPNPDDNLQLKLTHLRQHQLPLSKKPGVQAVLKSKGLPLPRRHAAIVKGYLFSPWGNGFPIPSSIEGANDHPTQPQCWWLYHHQISDLSADYGACRWGLLNKSQWLDPAPPLTLEFEALEEKLTRHFSSERTGGVPQPLMLVAGSGYRDSSFCQRFFVMPASWPHSLAEPSN